MKQLYAWVLEAPEIELFPYAYSFSTGSWAKAERPCYHCSPCFYENQAECRVIHPREVTA